MTNWKPNERPALRLSRDAEIYLDQEAAFTEMLQEVESGKPLECEETTKSWRSEIVLEQIQAECVHTFALIDRRENENGIFHDLWCAECGLKITEAVTFEDLDELDREFNNLLDLAD